MLFRSKAVAGLALSCLCSALPASSQALPGSCPAIEGGKPATVRLSNPTLKQISPAKSDFADLAEFSGLAIVPDAANPDGFSFWTVDDGKDLLIQLTSAGEIIKTVLARGSDDLEEIAWDASKERLAIISEQTGRIQVFTRDGQGGFKKSGEFTLSELPGYDGKDPADVSGHSLKAYYEAHTKFEEDRGERPNSGWEGMTFTGDGRLYVVKEKNPAILIEVRLNEADLKKSSIGDVVMLNCGSHKKGRLCPQMKDGASLPFADKVEVDGEEETFDFSGLAYDAGRGKLWMTSDKGRAAILFDPKTKAFSAFPLADGTGHCIVQPEGIALSSDGTKLFVVNDRKPEEGPTTLLSYEIK